jgi:hypothetical protein
MNHGQCNRKWKVKVLRRQNPLVIQNDTRRKQDVDKQVKISQKKRFADHFALISRREKNQLMILRQKQLFLFMVAKNTDPCS